MDFLVVDLEMLEFGASAAEEAAAAVLRAAERVTVALVVKLDSVDHVALVVDVLIVMDNLMELNVVVLVMMHRAAEALAVDIGLEDVVEILGVTVKAVVAAAVVVIMEILPKLEMLELLDIVVII